MSDSDKNAAPAPETTDNQVETTEEITTATATTEKPAAKKNTEKPAAKKNTGKPAAKPKFVEGKEKGKVLEVPIASIGKYDNPRNEPENLYNAGFILFGDPDIEEIAEEETDPAKFVSLVHLALHPDYAGQYVELIEEYEAIDRKKDPMSPQSIVELANDIQQCGQLVPILLRKERSSYTGIDGGRRIAAVLYLHAKSVVMRAEKDPDAPKKVYPATILATTDACKQGEVFLHSLKANLSRKDFTPLQEGAVYHQMLQNTNPATGKKWTMKDAAVELGVEYGTFRNREALWRPHDSETGRGLTDSQREKVAAGEMGVTAAARKALGEQHYAETGKPSGKRNTGIPLSEIQRLFDESAEANTERRQALAECMGLKLKEATKDSEVRIAKQDEADMKR